MNGCSHQKMRCMTTPRGFGVSFTSGVIISPVTNVLCWCGTCPALVSSKALTSTASSPTRRAFVRSKCCVESHCVTQPVRSKPDGKVKWKRSQRETISDAVGARIAGGSEQTASVGRCGAGRSRRRVQVEQRRSADSTLHKTGTRDVPDVNRASDYEDESRVPRARPPTLRTGPDHAATPSDRVLSDHGFSRPGPHLHQNLSRSGRLSQTGPPRPLVCFPRTRSSPRPGPPRTGPSPVGSAPHRIRFPPQHEPGHSAPQWGELFIAVLQVLLEIAEASCHLNPNTRHSQSLARPAQSFRTHSGKCTECLWSWSGKTSRSVHVV